MEIDNLYHNHNNGIRKYKECAGLKCSKKPTSKLKVKYINKIGYFCQKCTADLLQLELAEEIEIGDLIG